MNSEEPNNSPIDDSENLIIPPKPHERKLANRIESIEKYIDESTWEQNPKNINKSINEDIAKKIDIYKVNLFKKIAKINILNILKEDRYLQNAFVDLAFKDGYIDPELSVVYSEPILSEETLDIKNILGFCLNGLVILGEAGSGKSTLLKEIALNYSKDKIPIIIQSKYIKSIYKDKSTNNIELCISEAFKSYGVNLTYEDIKQILGNSSIMLMIDGLDEIPEDIRILFLEEIQGFNLSYGSHSIIVTSRIAGYKKGIIKDFHHVTINSFDSYKIKQFILRWFDEATGEKFENYVFDPDNTELFHLAGNPLLLTMMVGVFESNNYELPRTITELYRLFTHIMLSSLDEKEKGIKRNKIPEKVKDDFLQIIAYNYHKKEFRDGIVPESIFNSISAGDFTLEDILNEIESNSGLLTRDFPEYKFWHPSLTDYYCAKYIAGKSLEKELILHLKNPHWGSIYIFYFGLAENPEIVLENLFKRQSTDDDNFKSLLALLGNCFLEGFYRDKKIYKEDSRILVKHKDEIFEILQKESFGSKYSYIRNIFLKILSKYREKEVYDSFQFMLSKFGNSSEFEEPEKNQRMKEILFFIGNFPYRFTIETLKKLIEDPNLDKNVKNYAVYSLGSYRSEENVKYVKNIVEDEKTYNGIVRSAATIVLGRFSKDSAHKHLNELYITLTPLT